ncbi:hypothetical protein C8R43DRAFT_966059 [Mycena crocata]|nr:hypothetical protein C8R43DRAFT_966059 [Mycena crocata]
MLSTLTGWLSTWVTDSDPIVPPRSHLEPHLPNELWAHIFQEPLLQRKDLFAIFTSCRHFNNLVLPILLFTGGTKPSALAAGNVDIPSDMVSVLNLAIGLPPIGRLTCTFDISGDSRAPRDLAALKSFASRAPFLFDMRLNFFGDLLSAYKSDLVPLTPQRRITEPFCDLLSSISNDPVVFVGTEIFTCRAADIRSWQLDKYTFTDPGGGGLFSALAGFRAFSRPPAKHPLRTKTSITQHNGVNASVFPFISISSADVRHLSTPFSAGFPSWTLVTLNPGSAYWPNALNLSAALAAEEWAAILPLLSFPNLPRIRMERQSDVFGLPNVPAPVLDAFLSRHPTITRMYYYPDPCTIPDAPAFPFAALPRLRNISTTALGVRHLFHSPATAFPNMFAVCITGACTTGALHALARHAGTSKLILEVSTGAWMADADEGAATALHRVDTVILSGVVDFVDTSAILRWVCLFPALRRVVLQDCLHADVGQEERKNFSRCARDQLPPSVELMPV